MNVCIRYYLFIVSSSKLEQRCKPVNTRESKTPARTTLEEHSRVKDTREEHLRAHFTREDHSQLFHAGVTHSRVSREWDVASGRYRSYVYGIEYIAFLASTDRPTFRAIKPVAK